MARVREPMVPLIVFLTSFVILAYEINFTRVFAYTQWHNLSSLIISMALLGFGASGCVIAVIQVKFRGDVSKWLLPAALLFSLFLCIGFIASVSFDFNPYEISFSASQVVSLFLYFFLMGIAFFFGAAVICMAFSIHKASQVYFANLSGSAAGGVFVLCLSFIAHPVNIMVWIILTSLVPLIIIASHGRITSKLAAAGTAGLVLVALLFCFSVLNPRHVSQYKPVSGALNLPDSEVSHETYSPLGVVQVVRAHGLRSTTGLSLVSPYQVPVQQTIFVNGDGISPITPYAGDPKNIEYLKYLSSYLPFYILTASFRDRALIIGPGGGESILRPVLAEFRTIDAVETNQNVIDLMQNQLAGFSGDIYNLGNVNVMNCEARHFFRQTTQKYDLIDLSMIDSYNSAASGVYALNETYLYTVQSLQEFLSHLTDNGILAITRWTMTPARDNLKLFNMVIAALENLGIKVPEQHLIAIRSLQTLTLIVSKNKISNSMVQQARVFAEARLFDLVWYPGIAPREVNQHIRLNTPVYYQGLVQLLSGSRQTFIDRYDFDISVPTDNQPYFYNFFKLKTLGLILKYGISQIPVTEWGYLLLLIILVPVLIVGTLFILAPLLVLKAGQKNMPVSGFFYFSLIGMGFFFIEMPLIQKMILFLGQPVYSLTVVICALLFFSSLGSLSSGKLFARGRRIGISTLAIVIITFLYMAGMDQVFHRLILLDTPYRFLVVIGLLAPLGFFMGIPFPAGMAIVKAHNRAWVAMAWGFNGFFSVISILLATLLAIMLGFKIVLVLAAVFYLAAGLVSFRLVRLIKE